MGRGEEVDFLIKKVKAVFDTIKEKLLILNKIERT